MDQSVLLQHLTMTDRNIVHFHIIQLQMLTTRGRHTLEIQDEQLSVRELVGPVREGQQCFLQGTAGVDLFSSIIIVLSEVTSHVPLNGKPLTA